MSTHCLVKSSKAIFNNKLSLAFVAAREQGSESMKFG